MSIDQMVNQYKIKSKVWLYPGMAGWHFVSVPKKQSKEIKKVFGDLAHGWGSLPVSVKIGRTKWKTSIFPDSRTDLYILPLKAEVRKKELIKAEDKVYIDLELIL